MNAMFCNLHKDIFARIEKTQLESRVLSKLFGDLIEAAETVLLAVVDLNDIQLLAHRADKIHNMYIFGKKSLCVRNSHSTSDAYINLSCNEAKCNEAKCEDMEDAIAFLAMLMYTGRMTALDLKKWFASKGTFSDSVSLLPEKAGGVMA